MDVVPQLCQRQAASRNILQKLQQKSETRGAVPFQLSAVSPLDFIVFAQISLSMPAVAAP